VEDPKKEGKKRLAKTQDGIASDGKNWAVEKIIKATVIGDNCDLGTRIDSGGLKEGKSKRAKGGRA